MVAHPEIARTATARQTELKRPVGMANRQVNIGLYDFFLWQVFCAKGALHHAQACIWVSVQPTGHACDERPGIDAYNVSKVLWTSS